MTIEIKIREREFEDADELFFNQGDLPKQFKNLILFLQKKYQIFNEIMHLDLNDEIEIYEKDGKKYVKFIKKGERK